MKDQKWNRVDWLFLLVLTLIGAALRFYKIGIVPPGFQFDEAYNAIDAAQVLAGNRPLFLPANAGREVLYTYWQAAIILATGSIDFIDIRTLRMGSALAGTLSVSASYLLLRTLLRQNSRAIALLSTAALTINLWNIHFSHYGIRVIMMPMILSAAFGLYWFASENRKPSAKVWGYALSGLFAGISVWTHPTGRLVPFVLIAYTLWLWWTVPQSERLQLEQKIGKLLATPLSGLVLAGAVAFLVFLPLGMEFYARPDFFYAHASDSFIANENVKQGTIVKTLLLNLADVAGMFNFLGDADWRHNFPGRPVFDPLLSIAFLIGVAIWITRLRRRNAPDRNALFLLAAWVAVMLLPSVLSNDAPDFSRTLPTHPALFLPVGFGLLWLATRNWIVPGSGRILTALILLVSAGVMFYDYFIYFPSQPEVYYQYDADKLDALDYLAPLAADKSVYLSELWADHATTNFLRGQYGIKSIDTSDAIVLPPIGRDLVYAFPPEQSERAFALAEQLPNAKVELVRDRFNNPLLHIVQVAAADLVEWPTALTPTNQTEAAFDDAPTLLGMKREEGHSDLTLFWRSQAPTFRDLTSFVHLIDKQGHRVGQIDKLPANDSYRTPYWSVGERVIDRYWPQIDDPCVGGQEVAVQVGWYEFAADGLRRPRADANGDTALAGHMRLPIRAYSPDKMQPQKPLHSELSPALKFLGYSLHSQELEPGAPLDFDLFWQNDPAQPIDQISISIEDADNNGYTKKIWQGRAVPHGDWREEEVICRRTSTRLPQELSSGMYRLVASSGDESSDQKVTLWEMEVKPSTHNFAIPKFDDDEAIGAVYGGIAKLIGFKRFYPASPDQPLTLKLYWQSLAPTEIDYRVFVHLVDDAGQIMAQSDATPAGDAATHGWIVGEVVEDPHALFASDGAFSGAYQLRVGLYDPVSGERLEAVDQTGTPVQDNAVLIGEVKF